MAKQKSRILYLQKYLEQYTDENHPALIADMIEHLESLGISANRNTVADDIACLVEAGVDIVCNRVRHNEYFIGQRNFELPELKLLVDAVQASKVIPAKKSRALADKLTALASEHQVKELRRGLYIDRQAKATNEQVYITVDLLYAAINGGKRVRFKYYEYSRTKRKVYKHNGQVYELSPYGLIWNNDCYYAAGFSESHGKIVTFRVDRIAVPEITETAAREQPPGFDMSEYARGIFQMYDGPMREVTLRCENPLMKAIIDRFGEDVDTKPADAGHFTANVTVGVSRTFYGWVFSFSGAMDILAPRDVEEDFYGMACRIAKST